MTILLFALTLAVQAQSNLIDSLPGGVRSALRLGPTPESPPVVVEIDPLGTEREFYARREALNREIDDLRTAERRALRDQAHFSAVVGTADARARAEDALVSARNALDEARALRERAEQDATRARDAVRAAAQAVDSAERSHWQCSVFHAWCESYGEFEQSLRVAAGERLAAAEREVDTRRRIQDQTEQEYFTTRRALGTLSDLQLQLTPLTQSMLSNAKARLDRAREALTAKRADLTALNGFYTFSRGAWPAAVDAPFCQTAYAYHRATDDGGHPFFADPAPAPERDFGHGPLLSCTDERGRLTSVRVFDPNLEPVAYSEIEYGADGTVARVVIKDRLGRVIEGR